MTAALVTLGAYLNLGISRVTLTALSATFFLFLVSRTTIADDAQAMLKQAASEAIGTFCLVFAGTGAIVINGVAGGAITHVGIAFTFGLVVLAMIYTLGDVSGAHLNPAVTLGFAAARRFEPGKVVPYIISQLLGALAATGLLRLLFPQHETLGTTSPLGAAVQSLILETVLTTILMLVILSVSTGAKEKGITAGIAVGSVIALEAMFAGPICGASMNPARSIAPALISGHVEHLWIYLVGPVAGRAPCRANVLCDSLKQLSFIKGATCTNL
jgi:aquaporin Z